MKKIPSIVLLIAAIVAVGGLWTFWMFLRPLLSTDESPWTYQDLGTWGDSFGALTSLFTALGFVAVGATFWLQRKQIEGNEKAQHLDRFESNYFELIRLLREVKKDVRFRNTVRYKFEIGLTKRTMKYDDAAFRLAWHEVAYWYNKDFIYPSKARVAEIYHEVIHDRFESGFAPYFRLVFTILDRISLEETLNADQKIFYSNLLRTQLSSFEISVIGLNSLSKVSGRLKILIDEFHMLKYVPEDTDRRTILERLHNKLAFAGRD